MADLLIRDIPDEVIAAIDAHARKVGLSRSSTSRESPHWPPIWTCPTSWLTPGRDQLAHPTAGLFESPPSPDSRSATRHVERPTIEPRPFPTCSSPNLPASHSSVSR